MKKILEKFKNLISNRNNLAIVLYSISGTDPEKQAKVNVFLVKKHKVNKKIKNIIKNIYKEFLDCIEWDDERDLYHFYKGILKTLKNVKEISLEDGKVPYNYIDETEIYPRVGMPSFFENEEGLYKKFYNDPHGTLVALDYHTSYDRHYYIEVEKIRSNKISCVVHDY